jgi:TPR repeat protein
MKTIINALFLLVALTVAVPVFAQSDFEATKARAEAGDASAQYNLGLMYANGIGVARNDQVAAIFYRLAASQGISDAQVILGFMYRDGRGVAKNNSRAYVWFSVAAAQGDAIAAAQRDFADAQLSPKALDEAQAQATRCFESNFKDCE